MSVDELRRIEERMRSMDDHSLLRFVAFERSQYQPDAMEIAEDELRRRSLPVLTPEGYWHRYPVERIGPEGFCQECLAQTTDESPGFVFTINWLGIRLLGGGDPCPACGSIVQRKWICLVMPIVPLGRYRVVYLGQGFMSTRFVGRRLKLPG